MTAFSGSMFCIELAISSHNGGLRKRVWSSESVAADAVRGDVINAGASFLVSIQT